MKIRMLWCCPRNKFYTFSPGQPFACQREATQWELFMDNAYGQFRLSNMMGTPKSTFLQLPHRR